MKLAEVVNDLVAQGAVQPYPNPRILSGKLDIRILRKKYSDNPGILFKRWRKNEVCVDWNLEDVPVPATVLFANTSDRDEFKRNRASALALSKGRGGGRGWYMQGSAGKWCESRLVFAQFTDGDCVGEPVLVELPWEVVSAQAGDNIFVKVLVFNGTVYGNTAFAGFEDADVAKLRARNK